MSAQVAAVAPVLDPQVQFMRYCPKCGCEQIFIAGWQCDAGLVGYCIGCGNEGVALFTRTNSERMHAMKQPWVCESCGLSGSVELPQHADVWTGVNAIEEQHDRLAAKYAPACRFKAAKVRVHNPAEMNEFEWNRFVAGVEKRFERKPEK